MNEPTQNRYSIISNNYHCHAVLRKYVSEEVSSSQLEWPFLHIRIWAQPAEEGTIERSDAGLRLLCF